MGRGMPEFPTGIGQNTSGKFGFEVKGWDFEGIPVAAEVKKERGRWM